MQLVRTWLLVLSAAAFAAMPAGPGSLSYLCRMTGQVSDTCCCLGEAASKACGAQIMARDCCERVRTSPRPATTEPRSVLQQIPPAAARLAVLHVPVAVSAAPTTRPPAGGGARVTGPPRFLAHCSFLI
jgi:hypothetical protein